MEKLKLLERIRFWLMLLVSNTKGMASGSFGSAGAIIGVVLSVYVMAYTLPDAIVALSNATAYSGAGTAVINIATVVLPILVLFGCVLYLLPKEIKSKVGL